MQTVFDTFSFHNVGLGTLTELEFCEIIYKEKSYKQSKKSECIFGLSIIPNEKIKFNFMINIDKKLVETSYFLLKTKFKDIIDNTYEQNFKFRLIEKNISPMNHYNHEIEITGIHRPIYKPKIPEDET
jgi:hypothetical protein